MNTPLLDCIQFPSDLHTLSLHDLPRLVKEVRAELLHSLSQSGGHFASNLGVVELTVALHYVFDAPEDAMIWDVGHQAYAHKMLTGRRNRLNSIRQFGGLAPFPKREESVFDAFGVGHSSTSIGAALGLAVANRLNGKHHHAIAIIGDGAMTGGQAFEALNNAGDMSNINLLVILNDNEMSISPNVGALPKYLAQNAVQDVKNLIKDTGKQMLGILPGALDAARQVKSTLKEIVHPSLSLFDNFGFHYTGPIDGHDVLRLVEVLQSLKNQGGAQLLHIHTQKGKGFLPAERDPVGFHAIGKFDICNPPQKAPSSSALTYTAIFGKWLCDTAMRDKRLIGITPAMREGSGLVEFSQKFPERYFDVGIAEQHAATFAAGLACGGQKPVLAIYSTFLQRAYDQVIHDIALQNLPVLLAIDRAGIVGADGATHAGVYDLSFLRAIPNITIAAPSGENECRLLLNTCYALDTPSAVRYPRGVGVGEKVSADEQTVPVGKAVLRRQGSHIVILSFGSLLSHALKAAESLNATVFDMRFVKPIDEQIILQAALEYDVLVTLEENALMGGAGSAVLEVLAQNGIAQKVLTLGIRDEITPHGDAQIILKEQELDALSIERKIQQWIGNEK